MESSSAAVTVTKTVDVKRKPRRQRSVVEKRQIVEETLAPGVSVAVVSRAHGVNANQVFAWRRVYLAGELVDKRSKAVAASAVRLLPVKVGDDGRQAEIVAAGAAARVLRTADVSAGSIHIQFPKAQVRVDGSADVAALRVVLECLLR